MDIAASTSTSVSARMYVTTSLGLEKFASIELEQMGAQLGKRLGDSGKVSFSCELSNSFLNQLRLLRSVERLFLLVNAQSCPQMTRQNIRQGIANLQRCVCDDVDWRPALAALRVCNPTINTSSLSFRISAKIRGRLTHSYDSQSIAAALGTILTQRFGWRANLKKFDIEITVHLNDSQLIIGIPISGNQPLAQRPYMVTTGLRSSVAWVMIHLANIQRGQYVLDPMCGVGTLLIEGAVNHKDSMFVGCDNDLKQLTSFLNNANRCTQMKLGSPVSFLQSDATSLPYSTGVFDIIVCDLPFGRQFGTKESNEDLYPRLLTEFHRVLNTNGRAVLLTAHFTLMNQLLALQTTKLQQHDELHDDDQHLPVNCSHLWTIDSKVSTKLGELEAFIYILLPTAIQHHACNDDDEKSVSAYSSECNSVSLKRNISDVSEISDSKISRII